MSKKLFSSLVVLLLGLAVAMPASAFEPIDPCVENPWQRICDPGGGGGINPPPPPPPPPPSGPNFRLVTSFTVLDTEGTGLTLRVFRYKVRGVSIFQENVNGQWVERDADSLGLSCSGDGVSDQDWETNAQETDVEFKTNWRFFPQVINLSCYHRAIHQGVTYEDTTSLSLIAGVLY